MQNVRDRATLFSRLCQMEQEIASSTDTDELLGKITSCSREITHAESASILLLDEERDELYFKETLGDLGEIVKKVRVPLSRPSIAGYSIRHRVPQIINDVASDPRHFKGVDKATAIQTRSILAIPIVWGEKIFGVLEAINKIDGSFDEDDREMLGVLASHAAVVLQNVGLTEQLQNFFVHTMELIVSALESVEPGSQGHVIRVTRLATSMARECNLTGKDYENIWYGSYFHDIGKLLLGTSVIVRNDKRHPVVGGNMLAKIKMLEKTAPLVRHHHERWDGSGFPDHLVGEQIPLGARILALAEDFEEQSMDRTPDVSLQKFAEDFFERTRTKHDPTLLAMLRKIVEVTPALS